MHPMTNIAVRAARAGGSVIVRYVDRLDALHVSTKGKNDFVSEVDKESERRVIEVIRKAYPSHGILAEESGEQEGDEYQWVIDPLDGTTNFLHGVPHFAVSIALKRKNVIEHGVIFDPLRQELFTATRGAGARLDDKRIRVSKTRGLAGALVGTGFPFRSIARLDDYLLALRTFMTETAGVRRTGSAALDLAYVAAGRFDGFWELGLSEWDMAAGVLLVREAGGLVSDIHGNDNFLSSGDVVAGSPKVQSGILKALEPISGSEKT